MKRLLLALVPWMAMTSVAGAQTPVDVVFTHFGTVNERCVRIDDECFVPLALFDRVDLAYSRRNASVEVHTEDRRAQVTLRDIAGTPMVPLRQIMDKLGADTSWDGDHLVILSPISRVQVKAGRIRIESALPVHPTVSLMDEPNRVVVDVEGGLLTKKTQLDLDSASRVGQFKPSVVRVVLETRADPIVGQMKLESGINFDIDTAAPGKVAPKVPLTATQQIQYDPASDPDMKPPIPIVPAALNQTMVGPLVIDSEGDAVTTATLKIAGKLTQMPTFRRPDADVIEIVLPGASRATDADFDLGKGPTIKAVDLRDENGALVIALTLVRPMGLEFSMSNTDLKIQLLKPAVGNGKLAGKIIVVDAGHGGHDSGTRSAGLSEKNLTLSISKLLSQRLAAQGATVIMTRKTDVFIPLNERPAIANRNHADMFVSVHINSNEVDNTASGSITFFHAKDPICQLLADCIQREIVKVNGIGGMGVWSDQRIYNTGFAVLRGSKMPAVLVECGFLNTKKDRVRMVTDEFQNAVASAIVKGIKAYLGDEGKEN